MKKILLLFMLTLLSGWQLKAQSLTIVTPGIPEPYEVPPGTNVTFLWEGPIPPTAFFSHTEEPVFPEQDTDPAWQKHTNFVDNGNGTYSITLTLNKPSYIWGGAFSSWISQWSYSNLIEVGIASGVKITATDGLICNTGTDAETLKTVETFARYQWYRNNEPIPGATAATYAAKQEGYYKVNVPLEGKDVFSNTLHITFANIDMAGTLAAAGDKLTLNASFGMNSYQWLTGTAANTLTPITGAQAAAYTATLTHTATYYAVKGTIAGCQVQSEVRPASFEIFTTPEIDVDAPTNEYGQTCKGTGVTLSVPDNYNTYLWYQNDILLISNTTNTLEVTQDQGPYHVKVIPSYWPEVLLTAEAVEVKYLSPIKPDLIGADNYSAHCPGESISITLGDEGYAYSWYVHSAFDYTAEDKVEVAGYTHTFEFKAPVYVTVVGNYLGCESNTRLYLDSYESSFISLSVDNPEQQYLCPGSAVTLSLPADQLTAYTDFQWYKIAGDQPQPINGQNKSSYKTTTTGTYVLSAHPVACPAVTIMSAPLTIHDYTARQLYITADNPALCVGQQTTLNISDEWTNIQWFKKQISITSTGYQATYSPLPGAGTSNSQVVTEFNTYQVKAKHKSCPAGLKTTSAPFQVTPKVNPTITPEPGINVKKWHLAPFDSIANYLYCSEAPLTLTAPEGYTAYKWFSNNYTGDGNYAPGTEIAGQTGRTINIKALGATWYTAKVTLNGCEGFSDAVLIDTHVHNTPDVEFRNNGELCKEGDSTMLNLAFHGDWVKFEWYRDGELIPESDNDTLYARTPGAYTLTGYPSACPHIGYSSGLPVQIVQFPKATIGEDEDVIYAIPELGFYSFQWYLNGEPLEPEDAPWVRYKATMKPGVYTVEVTNPIPCSSLSDGFVWTVTGIEEDTSPLAVYPNPTNGLVVLRGLAEAQIQSVNIYTLQGQAVQRNIHYTGLRFDLSPYPAGIYILETILKDGNKKKIKIVHH